MPSPKGSSLAPKRIQVIDAVRACSILTVLAAHLGCHYIVNPSPWPFLRTLWFKIWINGGFGVNSFFVVSGFVITQLIARQPGGLFKPDFRDFYSRRVGRIIPLVVLTSLFGILMISTPHPPSHQYAYCFKDPKAAFTPGFWLSIATFTFYWYQRVQGEFMGIGLHWGILWSLSVEEQFYFGYPFLLKKLGNERNLKRFLVGLVFFPPLFNAFHYFYFPHRDFLVLDNLQPFASIATGCFLYLAYERFKPSLSGNKKACLVLCLLGLSIFLKAYLYREYKAGVWGHIFGYSLIGLGVSLFLLGGLHLDYFKASYWRPFLLVGQLSYGIYLWHIAVLFFLFPFLTGRNEFLAYGIFVAVAVPVAWLSYRFYEAPLNLFLRKTLGRPPQKNRKGFPWPFSRSR